MPSKPVILVLLGLLLLMPACKARGRPAAATAMPAATASPGSPPATSFSSGAASATTPAQPAATPTLVPTRTPAVPRALTWGEVMPAERLLQPLIAESDAERWLVGLVWESLLTVDPATGTLQPGLADEWVVGDDGLSLRFNLRSDVRWHDGAPLTAGDVVATLERIRAPGSGSPWQFNLLRVAAVEAQGDTVVKITLTEPACAAASEIGVIPIFPADAAGGGTLAGTGPFRLDGRKADGSVVLEANAEYRRPVGIRTLTLRPYADAAALQDAWHAGGLDVASLPADAAVDLAGTDDALIPFAGGEYFFVAFNTRYAPLNDAAVRNALAASLDGPAIGRQVAPQGAAALSAPLLLDHWALAGYIAEASGGGAEAAGAALDAAGWTDEDGDGLRTRGWQSLQVSVTANGENAMRAGAAALVAQAFREAGADSEVHVVDWPTLLDVVLLHEYDAAVISWPFPLDPDQRLFWHSAETESGRGFNIAMWQNPDADALLDEVTYLAGCDAGARGDAFAQLSRLLAQDMPVVPLFVPQRSLLVRPDLLGLAPSPYAGPFWNLDAWQLAGSP